MTLSTDVLLTFAADLNAIVARSREPEALPDVAAGLAAAIRRIGVPVDRLQLPLSFLFGLKHPLYAGIVLTWTAEDGSTAWLRKHRPDQLQDSLATLRKSPFAAVALEGEPFVHVERGAPAWQAHPFLRGLEAKGFTAYIATAAPLPDGARQVVSVATRRPEGFDPDVPARLQAIAPILSLGLFGLYQAQTAAQIAMTYLGPRTGARVINGEMGRGISETLTAAIAFIDIRGFTTLSAELGVEGVVPLLNATFDAIERCIRPAGGEILKLMGDAALVMFPRRATDETPFLDIVAALLDAVDAVHADTAALGRGLRVAVGLHVGEVMYGNVGSERRHDFTVMGSAVNLAARLEFVSKRLGSTVVVSQAFAELCQASLATASARLDATIMRHEPQRVAGFDAPVAVWGIDRARTRQPRRRDPLEGGRGSPGPGAGGERT